MAEPPPVPESLLKQIAAIYAPRQVILFGGRARGDGRPDGDIDLLAALDDDAPGEAPHRSRRHEARRGHEGEADVVPCRDHVLLDRARAPGSPAAAALREGVTVHERS